MKSLQELTTSDLEEVKIISFDADGVTVERGTEVLEKNEILTVKTKRITPQLLEKITRLKKRFHINFSSGRNLLYLNRMFGPALWENASIQGENGLFTLIDGQVFQHDRINADELAKLEEIRSEIYKIAETNENVKGFEPKQFIISVHCYKPEPKIEELVKRVDTGNEFSIIWVSNEAYDIYLKRFGKGTGIRFLADYLKLDASNVLAVGNDLNDAPMLEAAGIGVTTNKDNLPGDFYTEAKLNLGGEEVVDKLLELTNG